MKTETERHWQTSYVELKKASAVGAFLISPEAEAALRKLWKDKEKPIPPQDWFGQLEQDYVAARDCLRTMVEYAKRDLQTRQRPTRPHRLRRLVIAAAAVALVVAGALATYELRSTRRWPFSTGTRDVAFLGTTFGMSPQEARRTLAGFGAQLVTLDEYQRVEPTPNPVFGLTDSFTPLFAADRSDTVALVMPGIEMFDSKVDAEFKFLRDRLRSVSAYFDPISASKADAVVSSIDGSLRTTYQHGGREESKEVPGAYTIHYVAASGRPSLWVNLTDQHEPIIILTVVGPAVEVERQGLIQSRQQNAFGKR